MRIEIEPKDVECAVQKLVDLLKPLAASSQREWNEQTEETGKNGRLLVDVKGITEYLPHESQIFSYPYGRVDVDGWLNSKRARTRF